MASFLGGIIVGAIVTLLAIRFSSNKTHKDPADWWKRGESPYETDESPFE